MNDCGGDVCDPSPVLLWSYFFARWINEPQEIKSNRRLCLYWSFAEQPKSNAEHIILSFLGDLLVFGVSILTIPNKKNKDLAEFTTCNKLSVLEQWLLRQIRELEIFVIIDEIDRSKRRQNDLRELFNLLAKIAKCCTEHYPLKLCVTSRDETHIADAVNK